MIVADTSIWVDHFRTPDPLVARLLDAGQLWLHPFVVGEIAMGSIAGRSAVLAKLRALPACKVAEDDRVLFLVEEERLFSSGIGYIDAHLLASVHRTPGARLWTRDKRLHAAAERLNLAYPAP